MEYLIDHTRADETSSAADLALGNERQWYAIYTCANREKRVAAHLAARGVEHYLPFYQSVREWSDRRVRLQLPLFPGYLFVHTSLADRLAVLTAPGVVSLVGVAGRPTPLAAELICSLREGINQLSLEPFPYLTAGQRVSIHSGPLRGLTGILLRRRSGPRVVISIDAIERSILVDICAEDLCPLEKMSGRISSYYPSLTGR
jgi:transcription antitermination factor NusG